MSVESIWKQKPLNSWYERNLKSKNSVNTQMEEIRSLLHFIIQMIPNGSRVLPLSLDEVCCSSFRALSLLDLMSSSGISVIRRVIISKKMFWDCGGFGEWVVNSVADPGEGTAHLIFRQNWGPKGKKKVFGDPSPPHYLRVWMTGAPPPYPRALDLAMQLVCESVETIFRWSSFNSSQVKSIFI